MDFAAVCDDENICFWMSNESMNVIKAQPSHILSTQSNNRTKRSRNSSDAHCKLWFTVFFFIVYVVHCPLSNIQYPCPHTIPYSIPVCVYDRPSFFLFVDGISSPFSFVCSIVFTSFRTVVGALLIFQRSCNFYVRQLFWASLSDRIDLSDDIM